MAERIDVERARERVEAGALLVCAYDDEEKWRKNRLEGAISFSDCKAREKSMPKGRELIFYCA